MALESKIPYHTARVKITKGFACAHERHVLMSDAFLKIVFVFALILILPRPAVAQEAPPIPVVVSILPQRYFVEKIGGQLVNVEVMIPPGAEMETYEPRPGQMSALSRAKIYFACGVPFETTWLPKMISVNPKILVIHTDKNIRKRTIEGHPGESEQPQTASARKECGNDPHTWLSPPLVILQARAIFEALASVDPKDLAYYEANYRQFVSDLAGLDLYLSSLFGTSSKSRSFMVFHPAWGYFADAYGLMQVPVEVEGKEPKARDLDEFIKRARELKVKVIFVEPQYSPKTAQTIADAVGARLVEANDLAPDWERNLRQVAEQIKTSFDGEQ